jgi:hypothetical protein
MKTDLGILNSDSINRDGFCFTIGALEQGMFDTALTGMPSLVSHDFHRPQGWTFPFALYMQPGLNRIVGKHLWAEDEKDWKELRQAVHHYLTNKSGSSCSPYLDDFKQMLQEFYSESGYFYHNNCVTYYKAGVAQEIFAELFKMVDKDGLLYLSDLLNEFSYAGCGVFQSKKNGYAVFCHQYLRRSLSRINKVNTYFVDNFLALAVKKNITLRIKIDADIVGLAKTFTESVELDYCYGPHFSDDISKISTGVARHMCNDEEKFFSGVGATDFWWKNDGSEKVLEVEEVRESPSLGVGSNRYIHSIYDFDKKSFRHFDGAIRAYDEEAIMQRWDTNLKKAGKNSEYTKVFRIDGELSLKDWKRLIIFYFNGNPMTYEYFGIKEEYEALKPIERQVSKLEQLLPYAITRNEGLRIYISYHDRDSFTTDCDRQIINADKISGTNKEITVVEADMLHWKMALEQSGGNVLFDDAIEYVKAYDNYRNLPTVLHGNHATQQLINESIKAYKAVFLQSDAKDRASSLSLAWPQDDKVVIFSMYGNDSEVYKWFTEHDSIPVERETFRVFVESQSNWLNKNYNKSALEKVELICTDGIQFIKRPIINPAWIGGMKESEGGFNYNVKIPETETDLLALVEAEKIYAVPLVALKDVPENHVVGQKPLKQQELIAFVWTDKPLCQ